MCWLISATLIWDSAETKIDISWVTLVYFRVRLHEPTWTKPPIKVSHIDEHASLLLRGNDYNGKKFIVQALSSPKLVDSNFHFGNHLITEHAIKEMVWIEELGEKWVENFEKKLIAKVAEIFAIHGHIFGQTFHNKLGRYLGRNSQV